MDIHSVKVKRDDIRGGDGEKRSKFNRNQGSRGERLAEVVALWPA